VVSNEDKKEKETRATSARCIYIRNEGDRVQVECRVQVSTWCPITRTMALKKYGTMVLRQDTEGEEREIETTKHKMKRKSKPFNTIELKHTCFRALSNTRESICRFVDWMHCPTDKTSRQADKQADRQTDRQAISLGD